LQQQQKRSCSSRIKAIVQCLFGSKHAPRIDNFVTKRLQLLQLRATFFCKGQANEMWTTQNNESHACRPKDER
jgi:hypothetical protein